MMKMSSSYRTRLLFAVETTAAILSSPPPLSAPFKNSPRKFHNKNETMSATTSSNKNKNNKDPYLPSLVVFDLDDCLWTPEMHELYGRPCKPVLGILNLHRPTSEHVEGIVALSNGNGQTVTIYDGGRRALYELVTNPKFQGVEIAVASTSLEPSYSYACLETIEVVPGRTIMDVIKYHQVGRSGKLSPRKTSHFRELQRESGIPFEEMLFFDDCNWGDHVGDLEHTYGVIGQRTPSGLQWNEFLQGLEKYKERASDEMAAIRKMAR